MRMKKAPDGHDHITGHKGSPDDVVYPSDDEGGREPERRDELVAKIEGAFAIFRVWSDCQLLPGNAIVHWLERDIPRMMLELGHLNRVRVNQSYSKPRAELEREVVG